MNKDSTKWGNLRKKILRKFFQLYNDKNKAWSWLKKLISKYGREILVYQFVLICQKHFNKQCHQRFESKLQKGMNELVYICQRLHEAL